MPILISAEYNFRPEEMLRHYVNFGIGTMYTQRDTDMGLWRLREVAWHFALKPEVGLLYEINFNTAFKVAAKYYTGFSAGDLETQSNLTISGGFAFWL